MAESPTRSLVRFVLPMPSSVSSRLITIYLTGTLVGMVLAIVSSASMVCSCHLADTAIWLLILMMQLNWFTIFADRRFTLSHPFLVFGRVFIGLFLTTLALRVVSQHWRGRNSGEVNNRANNHGRARCGSSRGH